MTALEGKTIIATSDLKKANKLGALLEIQGAQIVKFPLIKITAATNLPDDSEEMIPQLKNTEWVVFSSSNGVTYFFQWLRSLKYTYDQHLWKYAVIGNATAETLTQQGLKADFISEGKHASEFGQELLAILGSDPKHILISAGSKSSEVLPELLEPHHHCQKVITYQTHIINYSHNEILELTRNQNYDIVLFMSPSAVDGFYSHHKAGSLDSHLKVAVIGKTTRKALMAYGVTPDFMPSEPNLEIFVQELAQYFEHKEPNYNN
jgi:uroporphyrinogen-III synthase